MAWLASVVEIPAWMGLQEDPDYESLDDIYACLTRVARAKQRVAAVREEALSEKRDMDYHWTQHAYHKMRFKELAGEHDAAKIDHSVAKVHLNRLVNRRQVTVGKLNDAIERIRYNSTMRRVQERFGNFVKTAPGVIFARVLLFLPVADNLELGTTFKDRYREDEVQGELLKVYPFRGWTHPAKYEYRLLGSRALLGMAIAVTDHHLIQARVIFPNVPEKVYNYEAPGPRYADYGFIRDVLVKNALHVLDSVRPRVNFILPRLLPGSVLNYDTMERHVRKAALRALWASVKARNNLKTTFDDLISFSGRMPRTTENVTILTTRDLREFFKRHIIPRVCAEDAAVFREAYGFVGFLVAMMRGLGIYRRVTDEEAAEAHYQQWYVSRNGRYNSLFGPVYP